MSAVAEVVLPRGEAAVAARWAEAPRGPLRLEDGRFLRIIFPGVPGGGAGPDFRDAILDAGGDILRGDVEIHLRASGWRAHGHHRDAAYGSVILHVVAENDGPTASTLHGGHRAIALLVLRSAGEGALPASFTPPCALVSAQGHSGQQALGRLGVRRLRAKAARYGPAVALHGPGPTLAAALLEFLGGPTNRAAFASLARRLPLQSLLERADEAMGVPRSLTMTAELKGAAATLVVQRAGLRPMASPARRIEAAGALFARLWPAGAPLAWPAALIPGALPALFKVPGIGRAQAVELSVNAALPVALAAGAWAEDDVLDDLARLPSPGTYGKLRRLEAWLGGGGERPFTSAALLQGGLQLHLDYCTRGGCGRCPITSE